MATPNNDSTGEEEDVGTLIYRESQLRKAEAKAAERVKASTTSTHQRRTSTRKRSHVANQVEQSFPNPKRRGESKRKRESSIAEDSPRKKVAQKQYRKTCSADGCTNHAQRGGVCFRHGAKRKKYRYECSADGCTSNAQKGGVCIRHGAKVKAKKKCSADGCTNVAQKGGVCRKHGAKRKRCSSAGCTNNAQKGGVCKRHGAKVKLCSREGCKNYAQRGGVCIRHRANVKLCSSEGCTNKIYKGGLCVGHGAKLKLGKEEYASGMERSIKDAPVMDVQTKPGVEECAASTGRIAMQSTNLLHLDQNLRRLQKLEPQAIIELPELPPEDRKTVSPWGGDRHL